MAVLAIDPGLVCTGWALFREAKLVACGASEGFGLLFGLA